GGGSAARDPRLRLSPRPAPSCPRGSRAPSPCARRRTALARGAVVGGHRPDARHGEHVRATDLDHVVAAAEEMVHPARVAAAAAAALPVTDDADVIAEVVANQRRMVALEAGDDEVASLAA